MAKSQATCAPSGIEDDYRAESDHHTLSRAEEIKADPGRMKGVAKHHKKVSKALAGVGRAISSRR